MIRPPPSSTLFPYTSSSDLWPSVISHISRYEPRGASGTAAAMLISLLLAAMLSVRAALQHDVLEEIGRATSELQSHSDLVCRLLLEKKKKENKNITV